MMAPSLTKITRSIEWPGVAKHIFGDRGSLRGSERCGFSSAKLHNHDLRLPSLFDDVGSDVVNAPRLRLVQVSGLHRPVGALEPVVTAAVAALAYLVVRQIIKKR